MAVHHDTPLRYEYRLAESVGRERLLEDAGDEAVHEEIGEPVGKDDALLAVGDDGPNVRGLQTVFIIAYGAGDLAGHRRPIQHEAGERDIRLLKLVEPARPEVLLMQPLDLPLVPSRVREAGVQVHAAAGERCGGDFGEGLGVSLDLIAKRCWLCLRRHGWTAAGGLPGCASSGITARTRPQSLFLLLGFATVARAAKPSSEAFQPGAMSDHVQRAKREGSYEPLRVGRNHFLRRCCPTVERLAREIRLHGNRR